MKSSAIRVPMVMASLLALASPALADSWQADPSHPLYGQRGAFSGAPAGERVARNGRLRAHTHIPAS